MKHPMKKRELLAATKPPILRAFLTISCGSLLLLFTTVANAAEGQVLNGHIPRAVTDLLLQPIGRLPGSTNLYLVIGLPLRNTGALTNLLEQLYNPSSPQYHHWLTPNQFAQLFGPTEQDYQAVITYAETNGLTVTGTHSDRTLVDVNGAVADIEKTLHVTMQVYQHPTEARTFYAPDVEPSIDLSVPLSHISGLNNFIVPHPGGAKGTPSDKEVSAGLGTGSGPGNAYWGNDYRAAYVPGVSLTGSGQVVGLLELDGYYTNDITAYKTQAGLPNVTVTNVLVEGFSGTPDTDANWVGEVSLDIEMAISMAPGLSKVVVYESANCCYYWVDILKRMQEDNVAKQLSCSWLFDYDDPNAEPIYQEFQTQGQSFFQCSGDYLAFYKGVPQWTDDANVTLVGGTMLTTSGAGGSWTAETTWSNGNGVNGSGGGISASYLGNVSIPSWQQGLSTNLNLGSTTMRNVPDVSMIAYDAWVISDNGSSNWWWGTSIAAPMWAGFTALANQQAALNGQPTVGFINPAIYAIGKGLAYGSSFHDITTGGNPNSHSPTRFFAVSGYDLCTGWGSPTGSNLINLLAPSPVAFQITGIAEQGNDIWITWQTSVGSTNTLQATAGGTDGSYNTNNFTAIFAVTNTVGTSTDYLDVGGATNLPSRYYRVRLVP
jgi:subtilase family serine protease